MILTQQMRAAHLRLTNTLRVHTHEQMSIEARERRYGPLPRINAAPRDHQDGRAKRVQIGDRIFNSQAEAAAARGVSKMAISKMVRSGRAKRVA